MSSLHDLSLEEKRNLAITMLSQKYGRKTGALPTCILYSHPFGLTDLEPRSPLIYLAAETPNNILKQMCYYLQTNIISLGETEKDDIKALRIICGQEQVPSKNKTYFEALTAYNYYLCGRINNFGGADIKHYECLEIIFNYLAELAEIKVAKVKIDIKIHQRAKNLIGIAKHADCEISRKNHFFQCD